jgi:hypothetical protein
MLDMTIPPQGLYTRSEDPSDPGMPLKATNTDASVNAESSPRRSTRISAQGEQLPVSRAKRPADGVNDTADAPASKKVGTDKLSTNLPEINQGFVSCRPNQAWKVA